MSGMSLSVVDVSAGYEGRSVVAGISFELDAGERVGIIGRNGAGKTTTLGCLMGLVERQGGRIALGGRDISRWSPFRRARGGLGYVPQARDIFRSLTVEENLLAAAHRREHVRRLELVYRLFPRLKERRGNGGMDLSGGEQQMLAVGRALVTDPHVLLLDEPLEGLSPRVREGLLESIEELATTLNVSCVMVEQHVEVVLSFCSRILILERGRTVFFGSADELRRDGELMESAIGLRKPLSAGA